LRQKIPSHMSLFCRLSRFLFSISLGIVFTACAQAAIGTVVQTQQGSVAGVVRNGALEFRGIPYAEPPVGAGRWAEPKPAQPWQGVLDASHFKPACPQEARFNLTQASDSEDCLYLDISLPWPQGGETPSGLLPVIVWFHGGALVGGSSSLYRLDQLANSTRAVVVGFNYRLGVLGFLAHPSLDSDYNASFGLEDQRLALAWVKDNIQAFGGDPNNVTVMGESAGAASICTLLSTPDLSAGLFQKAIVLSVACVYPWRGLDEGNAIGQTIAAAVGCGDLASALSCLRQKDALTLVKAASDLQPSDPIPLAPVTGTPRLPAASTRAFQSGQFLPVPIVYGSARDELRLYIGYEIQAGRKVTPDNYAQWLRFFYGDQAHAVQKAYRLENFSSAGAALGSIVSAFKPGFIVSQCLALQTARWAARRSPVYFLDFADRTTPKRGVVIAAEPDPGIELGAAHSTILSYLFPGFSSTREMSGAPLSPASSRTAALMLDYFAAFIRTGDPNGASRVHWPLFNDQHTAALRFDEAGVSLVSPISEYQCEFWRKLYPAYFN